MSDDAEAVEAVAQAMLDAHRARLGLDPIPLDDCAGPEDYRQPARALLPFIREREAAALRDAAERALHDDDECPEGEAAGHYMAIRHGGDTGEPDDWAEALTVARRHRRPEVHAERLAGRAEGAAEVRARVETVLNRNSPEWIRPSKVRAALGEPGDERGA